MKNDEKVNAIVNYLLTQGILIGSRRWGGANEKSDHDIVFCVSDFQKLLPRIEKYKDDVFIKWIDHYSEHSMYNVENLKITFQPRIFKDVINILVYKDEDITKIIQLNEYMDGISETKLGQMAKEDKSIRIKVVEMFLDYLFNDSKTTIKFIDPDEFPF